MFYQSAIQDNYASFVSQIAYKDEHHEEARTDRDLALSELQAMKDRIGELETLVDGALPIVEIYGSEKWGDEWLSKAKALLSTDKT